ncbi:MAG: hypothetical protein R3Y04_03030 [Rikenellaceae bacterium]
MKNIFYLFAVLVSIFAFSCNNDDDYVTTGFRLDEDEISAHDTTYTLIVDNTQLLHWTLAMEDPTLTWVEIVGPFEADTSADVEIKLEKNLNLFDREVTFVLYYSDDSETMTLTQLAEEITISPKVDTLFVTSEAQTVDVSVSTNVDWFAASSESWVSITAITAVKTIAPYLLTLDFQENTDINFRVSTITLTQDDLDYSNDTTFVAYQYGTGSLDSDENMLAELYYATNGQNWTNSWDINGSVEDWYGVTIGVRQGEKRVIRLDLSDNNLVGTIPSELGSVSYLEEIALQDNDLTGEIPVELGNLFELRYLYLYNNSLSGTLPEQIFTPQYLVRVHLGGNTLEGTIPEAVCDLESLNILGLENNNLTGTLPETLGSSSVLDAIYVQGNQLSGELPSTYSKNVKWKTWSPQVYICPQQSGFGFDNCSI